MANRYPLIVDTADGNKIKELPNGDNLNLSGSGIVNAASIAVVGELSTGSLVVNGTSIAAVATSGSYNDLADVPASFSGSYNDLSNKPTIPTTTRTLTDVQDVTPSNGDALIYNSSNGRYEPTFVEQTLDLTTHNIGELQNVITTGDTSNKFLKYYAGAWRAANVTWTDVGSRPTLLSQFTNDVGFITAETDSQTLSFQGTTLTISNGNSVDLAQLASNVGNTDIDIVGSVFADDSTLLVDSVSGTIVGDVNNNTTTSNWINCPNVIVDNGGVVDFGAAGNIAGNSGIVITALDVGGIELTTQSAPINILNNAFAAGSSDINILAGDRLEIGGNAAVGITAGPGGGPYADLDIIASATTITSSGEGGAIYLGGGNEDIVSAANALTFRLPLYADIASRNAAITSPTGGDMVFVQDDGSQPPPTKTPKTYIYDGTSWRELSWV